MPHCLNCLEKLTISLIDMGKVPVANHLLKKKEQKFKTYPLEVFLCKKCKLFQLGQRVNPKVIFNNYFYHSSYSSSFLKHAELYAKQVVKNIDFRENKLIFEIASNDGYLLKNFDKKKLDLVGIEPSKNVAEIAINSGVNTENLFFNISSAKFLKKKYGIPKLIIANNVLAHVPNLNIFFKSLDIISSEETIISIEFPSVKHLINENQFDTIYHEHYTYLCLTSVNYILKKFLFKVFKIEKLKTHGGSLRLWITKGNLKIDKSVNLELNDEIKEKIFDKKKLVNFSNNAIKKRNKFINFINKCKRENKKVYAYGAAAKGISFLNYCGENSNFINAIFDKNKMKQNCYIPGVKIKILDPKEIEKHKPDFIIILPWNLKNEIKNELKFIKTWGGKFISFD